ncbi:RIC1 protein [Apiospora arundinis]
MPFTASDICKIILAIFLPPSRGCHGDFFINILLTILGYIPGIVHAFIKRDAFYDRREDAGAPKLYVIPERLRDVYSSPTDRPCDGSN